MQNNAPLNAIEICFNKTSQACPNKFCSMFRAMCFHLNSVSDFRSFCLSMFYLAHNEKEWKQFWHLNEHDFYVCLRFQKQVSWSRKPGITKHCMFITDLYKNKDNNIILLYRSMMFIRKRGKRKPGKKEKNKRKIAWCMNHKCPN